MLYGYPAEATAENWLHETLCVVVNAVNTKVAANEDYPKWPLIIPKGHREALKRKHGLKSRVKDFNDAFRGLTDGEKAIVIQSLNDQNNISTLLTCESHCSCLDDLPVSIREPIKELFIFAFDLLSDLGIRDRHYSLIYDAAAYHVCPFCGLEYFDAPGAPREDYDHYLWKDSYTFAAVNLRNLAPMGGKCNSGYKKTQDMLKDEGGIRRRSYDPYNNTGVAVSLDGSVPFEGKDGQPRWQIEFAPATEESATWDKIFHIRERYVRDVLDPDFKGWLRAFRTWCRSAEVAPTTGAEVIEALDRYIVTLEDQGLSDRAFLKAAVFRMMKGHCIQNNQRLIEFLLTVLV